MVLIKKAAKMQGQLFDDSCDFGLWVDALDPEFLVQLREAFKEIKADYGSKEDNRGDDRKILMFLPYEMEGNVFLGVSIEWTVCPYRKRTMLTIDVKRAGGIRSELRERYGFKG
jgi:hypothetical protein